jgi:hypothetical protein
MLHETRQSFIHEEAKKLKESLKTEMNTPDSFFIIKDVLDRYDNVSKFNQPDVSGMCEHPFSSVMSKCNGEINHCLKCGKYI